MYVQRNIPINSVTDLVLEKMSYLANPSHIREYDSYSRFGRIPTTLTIDTSTLHKTIRYYATEFIHTYIGHVCWLC